MLPHSCAPCVALRMGRREAPHNPLEKRLHAIANDAGHK